MTTKTIPSAAIAAALAIAVFGISGCGKSPDTATGKSEPASATTPKANQYTCSMHPEVVKDNPGACPKCSMNLVVKK
jgi:hypothetical protein